MSSDFTSKIKITKNYQKDVPYESNDTQVKATKVYLNSNENKTYFGSPETVTNGHNSPEQDVQSPVNFRDGPKPYDSSYTKKYSDFKEDYDPDYKKNENVFWKDPEKEAKLKKDFYINHKKISEEEYNKYLDKENLREKSLLRRISQEDDIRDKARQYYEQNTAKKPTRTVSEIFSKRTQTLDRSNLKDPASTESFYKKNLNKPISNNETHTLPTTKSERSTSETSATKMSSILKGNNDYNPVYKTRQTSYSRKDNDVNDNQESAKKPEVYFTTTSKEPTREKSSVYDFKVANFKPLKSFGDDRYSYNTEPKSSKKSYESSSIAPSNLDKKTNLTIKTNKNYNNDDEDDFKDCIDHFSNSQNNHNKRYSDSDFRTPTNSSPTKTYFDFDDVFHPTNPTNGKTQTKSTYDFEVGRQDANNSRKFDILTDRRYPESGHADEEKDTRCSDLMNMYYDQNRLSPTVKDVGLAPSRIPWTYNKKVFTLYNKSYHSYACTYYI